MPTDFQPGPAHRYFSAHCYNEAWSLIDKPDRTPEDDQKMILASAASLYHWINREDCTDQHRSIGYWQLSRIYALLSNGQESMHYAKQCLSYSNQLSPFFLGYAYEALARAAKVLGDIENANQHIAKAEALLDQIEEEEERGYLAEDLRSLS